MLQIRLRKLSEKQRDQWLERMLPLVVGKDRREARILLFTAASDKYKEMKEKVEELGASTFIAEQIYGELRDINRLILYTYFPYIPEYEPGVVPPKGGPYDMPLEERFMLDDDGYRVKDGQLTTRLFERNRKRVTVSVEGFDKPLKLKTKFMEDSFRPNRPTVFGYVTIDDVEYAFTPSENKQVYYSDEGKIDEGKAWRMVGEPRPLDEWQIERRARTAKRRATQLTKAEKAYLDEQVIEAIRVYERIYKRSTQSPRLRDISLYWSSAGMGEPFEWPAEPSESARKARDYEGTFKKSVIRNSLNRLLRKELISKGDTARGAPSEYWIRVPYDE